MSKNRIYSLKKLTYQKNLPKGSDINNFEVISVTQKNGIKLNLYRSKKEKQKIDDTTNFDRAGKYLVLFFSLIFPFLKFLH